MKIFYLFDKSNESFYTDDVTRAVSFVQVGAHYSEICATNPELSEVIEPREFDGTVLYECDGSMEGCKKTGCTKYHDCRKTSDISAAKNFRYDPNTDAYYEMRHL